MSVGESYQWEHIRVIGPRTYTCGYCGKVVGPNSGFMAAHVGHTIYICTFCSQPTHFDSTDRNAKQTPGARYGEGVEHLPADIEALYEEARNCMAVNAFTAAVFTCRKLLMNVGVSHGAPENQSFLAYVTYLADNNYIPPNSRGWIDHIRRKGNEANHEIELMTREDAETLILFIGMLLKILYEFPGRINAISAINPTPPP